MSSRSFNWEGIIENRDGTFTTKGKREKRRLLKEFHKQSVAVRSKKNDDGSFTVTPIGRISRKTMRIPARSSKPVYATGGYRPISKTRTYPRFPHAGSGRVGPARQFGPSPRAGSGPIFGSPRAGPKPRGESLFQRTIRRHKENREAEAARKKEAKENEEKLRQERIAQERKETANEVSRQAEKRRLLFDRQQFERSQQAERMRSGLGKTYGYEGWEKPRGHTERHETMATVSNGPSKSESIQLGPRHQKEQKLDQIQIQVARQNQITAASQRVED
jgi:hypothetical protein